MWGREESWRDARGRKWSLRAWAGGSWFAAGKGGGVQGASDRAPIGPRPRCQLHTPRDPALPSNRKLTEGS